MLIAIIILVVSFLLMLLLGQLMYDTHRKIAHIIWSISLSLLIFFIYNFNNKNTQAGDENSQRFLGVYNIDISNSNYDNIDIADYYDLTLTVKADHGFVLSKESPFLPRGLDIGSIWMMVTSTGRKFLSKKEIYLTKKLIVNIGSFKEII